MVNNTETFWTAKGESLHTFARSIETLSGLQPPPVRGANEVIPLLPGTRYVEPIVDENTLTLGMWLRGVPQDAGQGVTRATKKQYQQNYNDLIRLLWNAGRQFPLTKRFYDTGSENPIAATAMAQYVGGLAPTMIKNSASRCTVDLKIAGAYFYADVLETIPLVNGDNTITVPGNAPTINIGVRINGARTNTRLLNKTNGVQFSYAPAVLINEYVQIGVMDYSAQHKPVSLAEYDASTQVVHEGAYQWLTLEPGENIIHLQSTAGAGTVQLMYRGAWV